MAAKKWIIYDSGKSGRALVTVPREAVRACSHQGDCLADVQAWLPKCRDWAADATLRAELKEYGAWDDLDTATTETLRERVLWCACGDIRENPRMYGVRL